MRLMVLMLSGLWLASLPTPTTAADSVTIPNCELGPEEEAQIPGQEAAVLTKLLVREENQVAAGQLLAQLDDVIPRAQQEVAKYKLGVAQTQAEDDIDVRFATAAAKVAKAEYEQGMEANAKVKGTVPQAEIRKRLLDWDKMVLSIEKARKDMRVAGLNAQVANADLNAATANVERRQITVPVDAKATTEKNYVVIELSKHLGEWVQIGEPVMKLVRLDRLRADGYIEAKDFRPSEIQDRPAQITVSIPHVGRQTFPGKIVYVKPVIDAGRFQVRAEVQNRKQDGVWVLNPGMDASMTIELR